MRKLLATALVGVVLLAGVPSIAQAQAGFIFGMIIGGALFGGGAQGGGAATILYSADEDKLKATNPLDVRMAATRSCFNSSFQRDKTGKSLGELFGELTAGMPQPKKERVILQIARVFEGEYPQCAAIWFAYIEK